MPSRCWRRSTTTVLALAAAFDFDPSGGTQFEQSHAWVRDLGLTYHVGMDGLSLVLVTLTAVCVPCALGFGLWARRPNLRAYVALILLLESALVLLLVALDLALFYVGFEAMIAPLALPDRRLGRPQPQPRRDSLRHLHARRHRC